MEAFTFPINGVIQRSTLLRIPYFQRRYVWKEEDWERFAVDMESTIDSNSDYFLGAIILKEEKVTDEEIDKGIGKKYVVIDGQQRLTTMAIYMKILHMMTAKNIEFENQYLQATDSKDPVIIHNCDDMPVFSKIMHLDTPIEMNEGGRIVEAYNYFRNYLNGRFSAGVNFNKLLNRVVARISFVVIILKEADDEQQIFDTINSLGVPLTTDELLKNFLYEEKDEQSYLKHWKPLFDTDEARAFWESDAAKSRQGKSKKNIIIERFFHAFVRIKMWDFKLSDSQKKSFVKMDNTFSTCKSFVNDFHVDKQALANEIIEYAKLYKEHLGDSVLDIRVPQHAGIKRISCFINATKTYAAIPYVLYILRNVNEAERNRIFGYMEKYLVRRLINKSTNNNYSDLFSENLLGTEKKDTFDKFVAYIQGKSDDASLAMPSISKVVYALNNNKFDEATARIVYYLYETKLSKTSDGTFKESYNTCLAEQLMPNPCTAANRNWMVHQDKDEEIYRQQLIGTLGNYFLLRVDDNEKAIKKAHNEAFGVKRSNMRNWSQNVRCCQQLDTLTEWIEKNINSRNNKLAKAINEELWKI